MWQIILVLTAILVNFTNAGTHHVDVGRTGPNFNPSVLHNVSVGDIVNFHFYPTNNSVAESTFDKPCKPKSGGVDAKPIYSGFVPTENGVASKMWSITINNTDPIWLYCSQGDHQRCRNGQSMVINPLNKTGETLDAYMEAALKANVTSPAIVFGGVLVNDDGGQPEQGTRARPVTSLLPSATGTSMEGTKEVKTSTNGVATLLDELFMQLRVWGILLVVFVVTL